MAFPLIFGTRRRTAEINRTCPAITPVLGSELIVNGGFATDTDWTKGTGWTIPTPTADKAAGAAANITQAILTTGSWYYAAYDLTTITGGNFSLIFGSGAIGNRGPNSTIAASYFATGRADAATGGVRANNTAAAGSIDNVSFKLITFASMLSPLGRRVSKNGTYNCTPTVTAGTQCGMIIEYLDANNFVLANVNLSDNTAKLISRIAGTYAVDRTGSITYGAAKVLKVIVNGTTHQLFYDGAQVGADVTIDNSGMGVNVLGFSTLAANTVGTVTTSNSVNP